MDRRTYVASLAAVAAGTGGCLRLSSSDGTATEPGVATDAGASAGPGAATDTPTATETATPEATADYPTGLSADGVSMLLLDKHVAGLADTSYTVDYVRRNVTDSRRAVERLAVEGQRALYDRRSEDVQQFIEVTPDWYDPVTWRTTADRTELYGDLEICCKGNSRALAYAKRGHGGSWQFLYWALKSGDYGEPTAAEDGDGFRIAADAVGDPAPVLERFGADRVASFEASGAVTPDGVVRQLAVSAEVVRGDSLSAVEATFDVSDLGATTVSAPGWVETARSRAPTLSVTMRDDRRGVVYAHEGGDPVPAGSHVGLHAADGDLARDGEGSTLDAPLEPGESLVAYVDGGAVTHATGGIPPTADPAELPAEGYTNLSSPPGPQYFKKGFEDLG